MSLNFVAEKQAWPLFLPAAHALLSSSAIMIIPKNQNKTPEEIILIASLIFFPSYSLTSILLFSLFIHLLKLSELTGPLNIRVWITFPNSAENLYTYIFGIIKPEFGDIHFGMNLLLFIPLF